MNNLKKTTVANIDGQIKGIFAEISKLEQKATDIAVKNAVKQFEGKWIRVKQGTEFSFYHIKKILEVNFSHYIADDDDPPFYCLVDREFEFTWLNGVRTVRGEYNYTLELGSKTKICTGEEIRTELEKLRKSVSDTIDDINNNFV